MELTSTLVLSAVPWWTIRPHRGQQHLPGAYWSSTTGGHVVYESRLELARLLLADIDRDVVGIAAQPFLVHHAGRRHVPDFLLSRKEGSVVIVNVKPVDRLKIPRVADALAWAGRVFAQRGRPASADPLAEAHRVLADPAGARLLALTNTDQ